MNYEFLDGFNLFLQTAHRCRHNGAVAVMDCLRNFVLYCLRNEWITKNPFRYYKLKEDDSIGCSDIFKSFFLASIDLIGYSAETFCSLRYQFNLCNGADT